MQVGSLSLSNLVQDLNYCRASVQEAIMLHVITYCADPKKRRLKRVFEHIQCVNIDNRRWQWCHHFDSEYGFKDWRASIHDCNPAYGAALKAPPDETHTWGHTLHEEISAVLLLRIRSQREILSHLKQGDKDSCSPVCNLHRVCHKGLVYMQICLCWDLSMPC